MSNTVQTRIVLRNADLSAWQKSEKPLLRGEMALARLSSGNYIVKIGDGEHVWNDLVQSDTGNLVFPGAGAKAEYDRYQISADAEGLWYLYGYKSDEDEWVKLGDNLPMLSKEKYDDLLSGISSVAEEIQEINSKISDISTDLDLVKDFIGNDVLYPEIETDKTNLKDFTIKMIQEEGSFYFLDDKGGVIPEENLDNDPDNDI